MHILWVEVYLILTYLYNTIKLPNLSVKLCPLSIFQSGLAIFKAEVSLLSMGQFTREDFKVERHLVKLTPK